MLKSKNKLIKFWLWVLGFAIITTGNYWFATNSSWENIGEFGSHSNVDTIGWVIGTKEKETSASLLDTIKNAINWTLGMLSLIALVVLLWGGFQMVTAAGDEGKHKKGFTILKQAAIGLIFIGLSWLFVSLIFWIISTMTQTK